MNTPSVNPILALLPGFLRAASIISGDPALGYRGAAITSYLRFAATAVERGAEAKAAFEELTQEVQRMADAGIEPTKPEWYDLKARADAAEMIFNPPEVVEEKQE